MIGQNPSSQRYVESIMVSFNDDEDGGKLDAYSLARPTIITLIAFLNFHACRFLAAAFFSSCSAEQYAKIQRLGVL